MPGSRILADNVTGDRWLIVDWENVPTFGSSDAAHRHDFQIWIGLNGDPSPVEDVTIGYGDVGIASADGLNAGAENRDGSSGVNITPLPVDNAQYVVATSPPTAGWLGRDHVRSAGQGLRRLRADRTDDVEPDGRDHVRSVEHPRRLVAGSHEGREGPASAGPSALRCGLRRVGDAV